MAKKSRPAKNTGRPAGVRVTAAKCVRCDQPVAPRFRPFCSQRCCDIDLAGWLTSKYRIPTDETPDGSDMDLPLEDD